MLKANSLSSKSTSSTLTNCFLTASGISGVLQDAAKSASYKSSLTKKYSQKVRDYASKFPEWNNYQNGLSVTIKDDESIKVMFTGSDEATQAMEMLEYGSTSTPPRSVIRVMEEELRQDYIFDTQGINL